MIYGVWMSLQNVDVVRGNSSFIGLGNYLRLFHDGQFGLSVLNTAWYTLTVVPLIVIWRCCRCCSSFLCFQRYFL
ncbi:MAG TPA: hypothetical protein VK775_07575 [Chthoniobacterales bacterium]|nr:hypothetical protein [Chthoniobacterales bacterium]